MYRRPRHVGKRTGPSVKRFKRCQSSYFPEPASSVTCNIWTWLNWTHSIWKMYCWILDLKIYIHHWGKNILFYFETTYRILWAFFHCMSNKNNKKKATGRLHSHTQCFTLNPHSFAHTNEILSRKTFVILKTQLFQKSCLMTETTSGANGNCNCCCSCFSFPFLPTTVLLELCGAARTKPHFF